MATSIRITMTMACMAMVASPAALGQLSPSGGNETLRRDVLQPGYRSERFFGEDPANGSLSRLLRPAGGSGNDDFPSLPASWFEHSHGRTSDSASADPLLPRSPEITDMLSRGAAQVRYRVPLNIGSAGNGFDPTDSSGRDPLNPGELNEDSFSRDDQFERDGHCHSCQSPCQFTDMR